ncbi:NAD(P)H-dependent oxidoreductase [Gordonia sp. NB41Y]|uniref:NADPH-dependent FMN reductase n=1 Tax=Gordonia sp. NB41Y TaxID=875808 RepID=UPI000347CBAC|nr:NAD(P)H-dependent oxidoreductase [Gordonia sp. NB41Y]KOY48989.1 FMN reductase [Gordonia sp. NB41Y]WLP90052.1 NAD(P)H-dependent oxidoreductase [Gordonia sp. NB41Y]
MTDSTVDVVALVGSLRQASINRRLAQAAADNAPEGVTVTLVEGLEKLPFYSEDIDGGGADGAPETVAALRERVGAADAVLIFTPEYNGSTPAVLKNAIDWLSRPYGTGAIKDKPVGVVSAALGQYAGTWSREDTRKSVGIAGGRVVEDIDFGLRTAEIADGALPTEVVDGVRSAVSVLASQVAVGV